MCWSFLSVSISMLQWARDPGLRQKGYQEWLQGRRCCNLQARFCLRPPLMDLKDINCREGTRLPSHISTAKVDNDLHRSPPQ